MSDPDKKERKFIIESNKEVLEPTIAIDNIEQSKINSIKINQVVDVLVEECPPKSSMHEWITGFDFLGERSKQHILNRIHIKVTFKFPDIDIEDIENNKSDIISAYKKATTDLTHLIDTE